MLQRKPCFLQLGDISVSKMMWFVFLINLEMRPLWHIGMYYIRLSSSIDIYS